MKKTYLTIMAAVICLLATATVNAQSWVSTKTGRTNGEDLKVKRTSATLVLQDGSKVTMPLADVIAYSDEGKVFRKLTLYKNGQPSKRMEFMQLLSVREDYGLYKCYVADTETPCFCYYVYQGERLCYTIDEKMPVSRILNLFQYFGIRAVVA